MARFLAWMDEQLMAPEHRAIAGVVLVQSPNHGSPLADTANADNVSAGLMGILAGLGGYPIVGATNPNTRAAIEALVAGRAPEAAPVWHFGIGAVCQLLDAAIGDTPASQPGRSDMLRTARKWLTGLLKREARHRVRRSRSGWARRSAHDPGAAGDDAARAHLPRRDRRRRHRARRSGHRRDVLPQALAGPPPHRAALVRDGRGGLCAHRHGRGGGRRAPGRRCTRRSRGSIRRGSGKQPAGIELPPYAHDFVIPSVSQALYTLAPPAAGRLLPGQQAQRRGRRTSAAPTSAIPTRTRRSCAGCWPIWASGCRSAGVVVVSRPDEHEEDISLVILIASRWQSPAAGARRRRRKPKLPAPAWDWAGVIGTGQSLSVGVMGTP